MNPLTQVKRTQQINSKEAALGISDEASWHAKYKDSAYVFAGGLPFDLTEGDLLAVFAQYGEVVDVNLVRDKGTGKSKGFAFVAYEDQRSTVLAVDNLNGAKLVGRIMRVDHVAKYKKKEEEEEDDETVMRKREERGVCYAFQRGECNRGASCRFSHDEQRNANTGWGSRDADARWGHDKSEKIQKSHGRDPDLSSDLPPSHKRITDVKHRPYSRNEQVSRDDDNGSYKIRVNRNGSSLRDHDHPRRDKSPESHDRDWTRMADKDRQSHGKRSVDERTENKPGYEKREKPPNYDRDPSYSRREDEREHKRKSHR